jgi:hypothetical protein
MLIACVYERETEREREEKHKALKDYMDWFVRNLIKWVNFWPSSCGDGYTLMPEGAWACDELFILILIGRLCYNDYNLLASGQKC